MSESERRRKYRYNRVLIETERILDPQFDDAVVFLSGAQIEMLRNVTQYLNRLDTYVSEQFLGYYLAPTPEDYDDLLEIVADLEEKLMGNNNTIFGYKETYEDESHSTVSGAGDKTLYFGAVAAGEILRLESARAKNTDSVCSKISLFVAFPHADQIIAEWVSPAANESVFFNGMVTIAETTDLKCIFYDCQDGDNIRIELRGYKMDVPG